MAKNYNRTSTRETFNSSGQRVSSSRSISTKSGTTTVTQLYDIRTARQKELDTYSENRRYKKMISEQRAERVSGALGGVKILILFMVIMVLVSALQGNLKLPTFRGLLEGLSNFDVIPSIPFVDFSMLSLGDWGVFNFIRDVISFGLSTVNILVFVFNGLVSIVNFVIFFVRWIFLL